MKTAAERGGTVASRTALAARRRLPGGWRTRLSDWLENETVLGYALLAPAILLIVVFIAYPFSLGVWLSLTDKLVGQPARFIGLRNFTHVFESAIFWQTVWNTVWFTCLATIGKAVLGMWLAVLLQRKIRFARFIRATVLLPFIVPTVLSGLAWLWMFDATFSVFNWTLRWLWLTAESLLGGDWPYFRGPMWLGDPFWAMLSIILVNTWRGIPFFAISFLAGLQTVPPELYDAGDIDGATAWQKFWHITLPLMKPIAVVVVVFSFVVTFADFQVVYVLTRGGPHNSTHLLATLAYQLGMASGNLGEGAAVALFMFPFLALVIVWQLRYLRQEGQR
ncbi:MAG: carbohydrate ABC transporter permease [Candidatus Tectimicrobiota bacterium]